MRVLSPYSHGLIIALRCFSRGALWAPAGMAELFAERVGTKCLGGGALWAPASAQREFSRAKAP